MFGSELVEVILIVVFILFLVCFVGGVICLWIARLMGFRGGKRYRWVSGLIFMGPVFLFLLLIFVGWWESPTKVSQRDVIGRYEIYRSFYSGEQADWQHATYADVRTETVWRYPIEWGWEGRWRFATDERRHHLVRNGPTLYRRQFSHYYVFESPLYGNVFLHRKPGFPDWGWWGAGGAFLILAFWLCARRRSWED